MLKYLITICTFFSVNFSIAQVAAKRPVPKKVKPLIINNIEYSAPTSKDKMGHIVARDAKSQKFLWQKQVYKIIYHKNLETDVQDIYIDTLSVDGNFLLIHTENNKQYRLNLVNLAVDTNE